MRHLIVTVNCSRGLVTVTFDGELDRSNAGEVRAALRAARRLATHTVVLDAQGITFVDAAGRRALQMSSRPGEVEVLLLTSHAIRQFDRRLARSSAAAHSDAA